MVVREKVSLIRLTIEKLQILYAEVQKLRKHVIFVFGREEPCRSALRDVDIQMVKNDSVSVASWW